MAGFTIKITDNDTGKVLVDSPFDALIGGLCTDETKKSRVLVIGMGNKIVIANATRCAFDAIDELKKIDPVLVSVAKAVSESKVGDQE